MESRKIVLRETLAAAIGVFLCCCIMVGIFAALDLFSIGVVFGAGIGFLIVIGNYFFMAITVSQATDRAQNGDVTGAQKQIQLSSVIRLLVMGGLLFLAVKLGANVIASVLPLVFLRPVLMVWNFFRKKGD